jgi:hypothetical protein
LLPAGRAPPLFKEEGLFFFEKKNQKTFIVLGFDHRPGRVFQARDYGKGWIDCSVPDVGGAVRTSG